MDADPERHLSGTSVFANAQLGFPTWMGLGHAAFWVYCRQDIYMALFSSRSLRVNFSGRQAKQFFDLSFTPASDDTWANRMIWIVAEIVEHCFGAGDHGLYDDLVDKVDRWDTNRPSSFHPIEHHPRSLEANRVFPVIKFAHSWHGMSILTSHGNPLLACPPRLILLSNWDAVLPHCQSFPGPLQTQSASSRSPLSARSKSRLCRSLDACTGSVWHLLFHIARHSTPDSLHCPNSVWIVVRRKLEGGARASPTNFETSATGKRLAYRVSLSGTDGRVGVERVRGYCPSTNQIWISSNLGWWAQSTVYPPSTMKSAPVVNVEASDAKYR
jgi:hypothetical protein